MRTRGPAKRATKPVQVVEQIGALGVELDPLDAPVAISAAHAQDAAARARAAEAANLDAALARAGVGGVLPGPGVVIQATTDEPVEVAVGVPPAMQRLIESVFVIDIEGTWKQLHEVLRTTEGPQLGVAPRKALAIVDDRTRMAHKLYCNLKLEYERYKADVEQTQAAMREEANEQLQAEKDSGTRKKAITNGDIRACMLANHPDEVRHAELQLRKFSLAVEHALTMVDVLRQKSRTLQVEVGRGISNSIDD
jgi:hypothetical protein